MKNDTRTTEDIERASMKERAQMSDTINDLQKKFSVETIVNDVGSMLRTQGGDLGRMVSHTVGRNPAAMAVIGAGVAWLILGQGRKETGSTGDATWGAGPDRGRKGKGPGDRYDDIRQMDLLRGERPDARDRLWYDRDGTATGRRADLPGARAPNAGPQTGDSSASGLVGSVKTAAATAGQAVAGVADSIGTATSDLAERLSHGLEDLTEEARARVLAARHAAHEARVTSEAAMQRGTRAASDLFQSQPLMLGALAVASGAALGSFLPHSRIEDEALGESSDQLFRDAQSLFLEERTKALGTLADAAKDVKTEISDVGSDLAALVPDGKSVGEAIVDRAANAAGRVYQRATGSDGSGGTLPSSI